MQIILTIMLTEANNVYPHIEEIGIQYACLTVSYNQELEDEVNKMWERAFDKKYPDYPN